MNGSIDAGQALTPLVSIFEGMLDDLTDAIYNRPLGQKHVGLGGQATMEWCVGKVNL